MTIFITIIHVFVCLFLVFVVLLQQGRGGGIGAAFGGASQQVFGGAGAGNFLTKLTEGFGFSFMLTCVLLAALASQRGQSKFEKAAEVFYGGTSSSISAPVASTSMAASASVALSAEPLLEATPNATSVVPSVSTPHVAPSTSTVPSVSSSTVIPAASHR